MTVVIKLNVSCISVVTGKKVRGPVKLQPAADQKCPLQNQKLIGSGLIAAFRIG